MSTLQFGSQEWQVAYAAAIRVLRDPHRADDAAQDAMIRAYRRQSTFSGRGSFHGWLRRIARNCALSIVRRAAEQREIPSSDDLANSGAACAADDPVENVAGNQLARCLGRGLNELNELDQIAFTERYLNGTSERELGALLHVSTNAAKQRAFRARRSIRQHVTAAGWHGPRRRAA